MKLNGNKKNGRYTPVNNHRAAPDNTGTKAASADKPITSQSDLTAVTKKKRKKRIRIIAVSVAAAVVALVIAGYVYIQTSVAPPSVQSRPITPSSSAGSQTSDGDAPDASSGRKANQYTFAILGVSGGNTDTMMVANFNAETHKLTVVSIPRDTLVNVSWYVKKINSLYPNKSIDGVVSGLTDILGFQVDFYVLVDLNAFTELVDAVGGVDFNVPKDMNYDDPVQDLHIHLKKGVQHLDGQTAIQLVRCRSVYVDADIGRIGTQQDFLKAASQQILAKQNSLNLVEMVNIFLKYVKTDLTYGNLIWFGKEFYKMDSQNIEFTTIPANYYDTINDTSYVTIYVDKWLDLVNEKLNPFNSDVTAAGTSIYTRNKNGALYVTNGVYAGKQSWGAGSSSGSGLSSGSGSSSSSGSSGSGSGQSAPSSSGSKPSSNVTKPTPSPSSGGSEDAQPSGDGTGQETPGSTPSPDGAAPPPADTSSGESTTGDTAAGGGGAETSDPGSSAAGVSPSGDSGAIPTGPVVTQAPTDGSGASET